MYHIRDDKRSKISAEMIYRGLIECLKEKSMDKLTVTEIAKKAGVGRATFYRNFDTPEDVLHMKCDACFEEVLKGYLEIYNTEKHARNSMLVYFFSYWMERSELLEALASINRLDMIGECHFRHSRIITEVFKPDTDMTSDDYIYFMAGRTGMMTGTLSAWIRTGKKKTPEELVSFLIDTIDDAARMDVMI